MKLDLSQVGKIDSVLEILLMGAERIHFCISISF